ncbi:uncharacterized protein LOC143292880 [Babylonia areolata]|uniref:uncharacterized protein LOC143292880 n=1 Tax=Babylonia areolata TaxID=304850 RepID=UPI003FD58C0C
MPGTTDIDAIESTLKKSLSLGKHKGRDLDQNVASSAQRLLQQSIEFVPAKQPFSFQFSSLKSKYILLKPSKKDGEKASKTKSGSQTHSSQKDTMVNGLVGPSGDTATMGESLPSPRVVIYPPEQVQLGWRQMHKVGGGLINMGNTCFMNSSLQCLTYTPPLFNYCLSDEHPKTCKQVGFCLMCTMRQHVKTALHHSGSAFRPNSFLHKLKFIAKHFRYGRQEDAHEFIRLLMDGLQKACLDGHKKLDRLSKETTVIHQIFGGFLRSQVQCLKCSARSNTYEPFMDLSLNLKDVTTVEAALAKFVKPETLDAANAYACERCRQKTPARKKFSLHKIPNVLTIQLNRFGFTRAAGKINKHIQFPDKLNIRPYMSHRQGEAECYNLYAVLIHSGHHCSMGHYYCYVRAPSNVWYIMNDASVHSVSASQVFASQAYLLFYSKAVSSRSQASPKAPLIAPSLPNGLVNPKFNGAFSKQTAGSSSSATPAKGSGDVGVPVSRQMVSPTKLLQSPFASGSSGNSTKAKQVLWSASKNGPSQPAQNSSSQANKSDKSPSGQRVVMEVKNGKVVTVEKSESDASKALPKPVKKTPSFVWDDDKSGTKREVLKDSEKVLSDKNSKVTAKFKDRDKENSISEKSPKAESSKFTKDLFKRKSEQLDLDGHHVHKQQPGKDDGQGSDLLGVNSTLKLEKHHSSAGEKTSPKLKKEIGEGMHKPPSAETGALPKLKKRDSSVSQKENSDSTHKPPSAEIGMPKLKKRDSSVSQKENSDSTHKPPSAEIGMPKLKKRDSSVSQKENSDSTHKPPSSEIGTPKLKKRDSSVSQKENGDSTHKPPSSEIGMPKLKKRDSSVVNKVSVNVPKLVRVNSSPAAHNVWHVHAVSSAPTPSLDSSSITPTSEDDRHTDKMQLPHGTQWMVTSSGKKRLLARSESFNFEGVKKRKLSLLPSPQEVKHGQSLHGDSGLDASSHKRTKVHTDASTPDAQTEHSLSLVKNHTSMLVQNTKPIFSTPKGRTGSAHSSKASLNGETVCENGDSPATDSAERTPKKHKKKHKKKHEHDHDVRSETEKGLSTKSVNSDSSDPPSRQNNTNHKVSDHGFNSCHANTHHTDSHSEKKRKRQADLDTSSDEAVSAKKSLKHSESENAQKEHAEKTLQKENVETQLGSARPVPVQAWDHYVKDSLGLKKKKQGQDSPIKQQPALLWDGSRKSEVVEELRKKATVTTWGGEKSEMEIEAEKEEKRRKKKTWKDHYEEEIDRGKVKKVKKKTDDTPWPFNPFQKYQNQKNNEKYRWDEDFGSGQKTHSFASDLVPSLGRSQSDMGSVNHMFHSSNSSSSSINNNGNSSTKSNHHPLLPRSHSYQ